MWLLNRLASDLIERCPRLYFAVQNRRLGDSPVNRLVRPDSELVIEGFPRCANSFAVKALESTDENNRRIFQSSGGHLSPSAERDVIREWLRDFYRSRENRRNETHADREYERFRKDNHLRS